MTPGEEAAVMARLDALHEDIQEVKSDVKEVKEEVRETNGRVRRLETWRANVEGRLSVITAGGRGLFLALAAPVITGVVTAVVVGALVS